MKVLVLPLLNSNMTNIIFLALGSNKGHKKNNILSAISLLREHVDVIKVAPMYETMPWGYDNQENFFNTALVGKTILSPLELITFTQSTEKSIGRIKETKNGPREIDIDIIFYNKVVIETVNLKIPHPEMKNRDFVLKPLLDLNPHFVDPISKNTISSLYLKLRTPRLVIRKIPHENTEKKD